MLQVLQSGRKTRLLCSRNLQARKNYYEVYTKLLSRPTQVSEMKPLLPQLWTDTRMKSCRKCSILEQQTKQNVKNRPNSSVDFIETFEIVVNCSVSSRSETKQSINLLNKLSFNEIISRSLCTSPFTKIDSQHTNCDINIAVAPELIRHYSTKSKKISDDVESWEMLVDYKKLSPMELQIHERHRDAVRQGKTMYVDPLTGYQVMTRLAHLERGECCGNACRHCPYGQSKVLEEKNKKSFNSAFYV